AMHDMSDLMSQRPGKPSGTLARAGQHDAGPPRHHQSQPVEPACSGRKLAQVHHRNSETPAMLDQGSHGDIRLRAQYLFAQGTSVQALNPQGGKIGAREHQLTNSPSDDDGRKKLLSIDVKPPLVADRSLLSELEGCLAVYEICKRDLQRPGNRHFSKTP